MSGKYGPSRGELWFRLVVSILGFAFMVAAVAYRGMPSGPAIVEVVGIAGVFFGGTALWAAWTLWRGR